MDASCPRVFVVRALREAERQEVVADRVAAVHEEKKVLEEDFKKHFEDYKSKKKDLENKVAAASTKWEEWKKSQLSAKK